jgi:hypothetical protein
MRKKEMFNGICMWWVCLLENILKILENNKMTPTSSVYTFKICRTCTKIGRSFSFFVLENFTQLFTLEILTVGV